MIHSIALYIYCCCRAFLTFIFLLKVLFGFVILSFLFLILYYAIAFRLSIYLSIYYIFWPKYLIVAQSPKLTCINAMKFVKGSVKIQFLISMLSINSVKIGDLVCPLVVGFLSYHTWFGWWLKSENFRAVLPLHSSLNAER